MRVALYRGRSCSKTCPYRTKLAFEDLLRKAGWRQRKKERICDKISSKLQSGQYKNAKSIFEKMHFEVGFEEERGGIAYVLSEAVSGVEGSQGERAHS